MMSRCVIQSDARGDHGFRQRIARNLERHDRAVAMPEGLRAAAVAVALVTNDRGRQCFVLTRRARSLRAHGGQWALPGGRVDEREDAAAAALRELAEEVGVLARGDDVLGLLDDYATRSGFVITPVVVWCGNAVELRPNPAEVAEIHRVPVEELMKPGIPVVRSIPESDRPVISIPLVGTQVHAPTAAILYQFREVALLARRTRVAHFEQPVFAWR